MKFSCAFFIFLISCSSIEDQNIIKEHELNDNSIIAIYDITALTINGHFVSTEEFGIDCEIGGPPLMVRYEDLETQQPVVPIYNPDLLCDPLQEWSNGMSIECGRVDHIGTILYWQRFYLFLNKNSIGEFSGLFTWMVDGGENFWCVHNFAVTSTDIEYMYR